MIKNVFYTLQGGYSQITSVSEDARHGDNLFDYGYLGKFVTTKRPSYEYGQDDATGMYGYIHNGFEDLTYAFTPSDINPVLANYTTNYYNLYPDAAGHWQNADQVQLGGGLLNGQLPNSVNSLWTNVGVPYTGYSFTKQTQYNIDVNGSADIGNHAIQINPARNGKSERRECIPSTVQTVYFPPAETTPASSISSTPTEAEVLPIMRAICRCAKKSPFPRDPTPNSPILTPAGS